jgi:hypothetical protein
VDDSAFMRGSPLMAKPPSGEDGGKHGTLHGTSMVYPYYLRSQLF